MHKELINSGLGCRHYLTKLAEYLNIIYSVNTRQISVNPYGCSICFGFDSRRFCQPSLEVKRKSKAAVTKPLLTNSGASRVLTLIGFEMIDRTALKKANLIL
jgi:hypothetical protein